MDQTNANFRPGVFYQFVGPQISGFIYICVFVPRLVQLHPDYQEEFERHEREKNILSGNNKERSAEILDQLKQLRAQLKTPQIKTIPQFIELPNTKHSRDKQNQSSQNTKSKVSVLPATNDFSDEAMQMAIHLFLNEETRRKGQKNAEILEKGSVTERDEYCNKNGSIRKKAGPSDTEHCGRCRESTQHHCQVCGKPVCQIGCTEPIDDNEYRRKHLDGDPRCSVNTDQVNKRKASTGLPSATEITPRKQTKSSNNSVMPSTDDETCEGCGKVYKRLLAHLKNKLECREKYEGRIEQMEYENKEKRKQANKESKQKERMDPDIRNQRKRCRQRGKGIQKKRCKH